MENECNLMPVNENPLNEIEGDRVNV